MASMGRRSLFMGLRARDEKEWRDARLWCRVADGKGIEWSGLVASEAHGGFGDAVEGFDVVRREVPDEKMAVPVGGEAHGVELRWCSGRVLSLRLPLRGSHVDLLPADGVGRGLRRGPHAGHFRDDLRHVVEQSGAGALVLGVQAVDVEFGEKKGRRGGWCCCDLSTAIGGGLSLRSLRWAGVRKLEKKRGAQATPAKVRRPSRITCSVSAFTKSEG